MLLTRGTISDASPDDDHPGAVECVDFARLGVEGDQKVFSRLNMWAALPVMPAFADGLDAVSGGWGQVQ